MLYNRETRRLSMKKYDARSCYIFGGDSGGSSPQGIRNSTSNNFRKKHLQINLKGKFLLPTDSNRENETISEPISCFIFLSFQ